MTQPLFVPPALARQHCPPGMKSLYLPAAPPVFVQPGHQRLAQGPSAIPHQPQHRPPVHESDVFDVMNEIQLNDEVSSLHQSGLQKRQNQWQQWSQDIIPALVKPYMQYLKASQSLRVTVDLKVLGPGQCLTCPLQWLTVCCLFFDRVCPSHCATTMLTQTRFRGS